MNLTPTPHQHGPACRAAEVATGRPCTRQVDTEIEVASSVTDILDLREFQNELKKRGRKPARPGDPRWWKKMVVKAFLATLQAAVLALIARYLGVVVPGAP